MTPPTERAAADLRLSRAAVFTVACVLLSAAGHGLAAGAPVPLWSLGVGCALVFVVAAPLAGRERSLPGIALGLAVGQLALHTLFTCGTPGGGRHGTPGHGGAATEGFSGVLGLARQLVCGGPGAPLTEAEARRIVSDAGLTPPSGSTSAQLAAVHGAGTSSAPGAGTGHTTGPDLAIGGLPTDPVSCLQHAVRAAMSVIDAPMLLGHLLAALVLGWLLRRGEAALWHLVRLSTAVVRATGETLRLRALGAALRLVRMWCLGSQQRPTVPRVRCDQQRCLSPYPTAVLQHAVVLRGPPVATGAFTLAA